jgi:hypothetical protein
VSVSYGATFRPHVEIESTGEIKLVIPIDAEQGTIERRVSPRDLGNVVVGGFLALIDSSYDGDPGTLRELAEVRAILENR